MRVLSIRGSSSFAEDRYFRIRHQNARAVQKASLWAENAREHSGGLWRHCDPGLNAKGVYVTRRRFLGKPQLGCLTFEMSPSLAWPFFVWHLWSLIDRRLAEGEKKIVKSTPVPFRWWRRALCWRQNHSLFSREKREEKSVQYLFIFSGSYEKLLLISLVLRTIEALSAVNCTFSLAD